MKLRTALAGLLLSLPPGLAWAQVVPQQPARAQPATTPKIDSAKEADIQHLMEVTGIQKQMQQILPIYMEQIKAQMQKMMPAEERSQKITLAMLGKIQTHMKPEDFLPEIEKVYDRYLSDEDIKATIQFYESPAGQKWVQSIPQISKDMFKVSLDYMQKIMPQIWEEMQQEFPELKQRPNPFPKNPS